LDRKPIWPCHPEDDTHALDLSIMIGHSTNIRYHWGMNRSHLMAARLILDVVEPERKTDDEPDDDRRDRARRVLRAIRGTVFETYLH
jgi:hypothetical protein